MGLSMAAAVDDNKNNIYNTQVYGVKGNSSLMDAPFPKDSGITQVTVKATRAGDDQ